MNGWKRYGERLGSLLVRLRTFLGPLIDRYMLVVWGLNVGLWGTKAVYEFKLGIPFFFVDAAICLTFVFFAVYAAHRTGTER